MFKYLWIIILAVIWIIWLIATVIDVIDSYRICGFCSDFWDTLDDCSQTFITWTFVILFIFSFISWVRQFIG